MIKWSPCDPVLLNGLLVDPAEIDRGGWSGLEPRGAALSPKMGGWAGLLRHNNLGRRYRQALIPCTPHAYQNVVLGKKIPAVLCLRISKDPSRIQNYVDAEK